jgi:glucose/arabinose dehydrogenase
MGMKGISGAATGRVFLFCALVVAFLLVSARSTIAITAQLIASGLSQPLYVATAPGDTTHIYIVQQTGEILRFDLQTSTFDPKPFVNVSAKLTSTSGEQGLLGFAFDPNYDTNGRFYLNYTVPGGQWGNGITRVTQGHIEIHKKKKKHKTARVLVETLLLKYDHPQTNHNGGDIRFSSRANDNHNLYIFTGDGGNGYDQGTGHIEPGGNAQNNTTLLGKILRIHVDPSTGAVTIPANNPFANSTTLRKEIFANGVRNPFRNSFDSQTGDLFLGEVGQDTREEIDVQKASNPGGGENYGWRLREGAIQTPGSVGGAKPSGNVDPILDYDHSVGQTVIGGYMYRGSQVPQLAGKYVFGDYAVGKIFTLDYNGTTASNFTDITALLFPTRSGNVGLSNPSSFGEDASGELYICDIGAGKVFKIVP